MVHDPSTLRPPVEHIDAVGIGLLVALRPDAPLNEAATSGTALTVQSSAAPEPYLPVDGARAPF